ncbi:hypothetical protein TNCV_1676721 [Trichonephila clavipes]|nr:hypothetical protein TNCV_1676721 [Trichonephila clavipes]
MRQPPTWFRKKEKKKKCENPRKIASPKVNHVLQEINPSLSIANNGAKCLSGWEIGSVTLLPISERVRA